MPFILYEFYISHSVSRLIDTHFLISSAIQQLPLLQLFMGHAWLPIPCQCTSSQDANRFGKWYIQHSLITDNGVLVFTVSVTCMFVIIVRCYMHVCMVSQCYIGVVSHSVTCMCVTLHGIS